MTKPDVALDLCWLKCKHSDVDFSLSTKRIYCEIWNRFPTMYESSDGSYCSSTTSLELYSITAI